MQMRAAVQAAVAPRGSEISVLMLEAYSCLGVSGRTGPTCSCGICRNNHCKLAEGQLVLCYSIMPANRKLRSDSCNKQDIRLVMFPSARFSQSIIKQ